MDVLAQRAGGARRGNANREPSEPLDLEAHSLIEASRLRVTSTLSSRERIASLVVAAGFLAAAVPMAALSVSNDAPEALTLILLVLAYSLASRVAFEVGSGVVVPTELVLVPMLFLLPPGIVPLCVAAGLVLSVIVDHLTRGTPVGRSAVVLCNSWHAIGPALVFLLGHEHEPAWSSWPIYLGALAAQFTFDFASSAAREHFALGVSPREVLRFMGLVFLVDAALAPVGLLAAFGSLLVPDAFLLVLPLTGLLAFFARERRTRIDHALELSHAYRGTALLLGDVVEADDLYTGAHCRDVVSLALGVADELGLNARARRDAELAALLHDVGKIRVPKELINKRGPLTDEERAIVERHTLEGQRMLERVGGLLGEIGLIVRSHHERWDGTGYPDGLAGEAIPLVSRIVSCCDAFNAMTSDRPYRAALAVDVAVAELQQHAGTQFDPAVVSALVRLLEREGQPASTASAELDSP